GIVRNPDPRLRVQGPGEVLGDQITRPQSGDAAQDLAGEPAEGQREVAELAAGLELWTLVLDGVDDRSPADDVLKGEVGVERDHPGAVGEDVPDRRPVLAVLPISRPDGHHRVVEAEEPAL